MKEADGASRVVLDASHSGIQSRNILAHYPGLNDRAAPAGAGEIDVYGLRTINLALLPELKKKQRLAIPSMRTAPHPQGLTVDVLRTM